MPAVLGQQPLLELCHCCISVGCLLQQIRIEILSEILTEKNRMFLMSWQLNDVMHMIFLRWTAFNKLQQEQQGPIILDNNYPIILLSMSQSWRGKDIVGRKFSWWRKGEIFHILYWKLNHSQQFCKETPHVSILYKKRSFSGGLRLQSINLDFLVSLGRFLGLL